eukprot:3940899-Rhodomonas_salina.2
MIAPAISIHTLCSLPPQWMCVCVHSVVCAQCGVCCAVCGVCGVLCSECWSRFVMHEGADVQLLLPPSSLLSSSSLQGSLIFPPSSLPPLFSLPPSYSFLPSPASSLPPLSSLLPWPYSSLLPPSPSCIPAKPGQGLSQPELQTDRPSQGRSLHSPAVRQAKSQPCLSTVQS